VQPLPPVRHPKLFVTSSERHQTVFEGGNIEPIS
jgi:hypothetical protein